MLSSGGGQAFSSIGRTILADLLAQPARSFRPRAAALCAGARRRDLGAHKGFWVSRGSTCLLYKAVNEQQAPSAKLRPAPALLRLDLFYLKETFEEGLFMHMKSSCFQLAGEHTNGGELFHMAVTGLRYGMAVFSMHTVFAVGTRVRGPFTQFLRCSCVFLTRFCSTSCRQSLLSS